MFQFKWARWNCLISWMRWCYNEKVASILKWLCPYWSKILRLVEHKQFQGYYCCICKRAFELSKMGRQSVVSHIMNYSYVTFSLVWFIIYRAGMTWKSHGIRCGQMSGNSVYTYKTNFMKASEWITRIANVSLSIFYFFLMTLKAVYSRRKLKPEIIFTHIPDCVQGL